MSELVSYIRTFTEKLFQGVASGNLDGVLQQVASFKVVVGSLLALFLIYCSLKRDFRPDKSIPMLPFTLPFVGNLGTVIYSKLRGRVMYDLVENQMRYGKYWIKVPVVGPELTYADPPSIKVVLEDIETFIVPPLRKVALSEIFGEGIFLSNGDSWAHQRELAKPVFSLPSRTEMFEVYHKCCDNLMTILENHLQSRKPLELQQLFKRFTLDTFGEIAFGCSFNSLIKPIPFSDTFEWLLQEVDNRITYPWVKFTNHFEWKRQLQSMERFIQQIIEERRRDGWEGKADFLSKLLEMEANKEVTGLTTKFLRDQVVNFMIAGRDTTAILLAATFYFLSFHPEVDAKIREEITNVIGDEKVSIKHTKDLKYLQNVLNESLRLFPPAVPYNSRYVTKDVTLPNGAHVPKGTSVMYSPYVVHRLPEYWGNDAEQFIPDRWNNKDLIKHPYQYLPFQKGPRICLGMNMAYEEAKCCIAILYQNGFHFEVVHPKHKIVYLSSAVLIAKDGITATVNKV